MNRRNILTNDFSLTFTPQRFALCPALKSFAIVLHRWQEISPGEVGEEQRRSWH